MPGDELWLFLSRVPPAHAEAMNARFRQASQAPDAAEMLGDAASAGAPLLDQACCCVARAVVRVVMPPAPGRPHETELLLCGHHYRVSREALAAAHARVEDLAGSDTDTTAWFYDDRARAHAMVVSG
jgi:hypothetical protein